MRKYTLSYMTRLLARPPLLQFHICFVLLKTASDCHSILKLYLILTNDKNINIPLITSLSTVDLERFIYLYNQQGKFTILF